MIVLISHDRRPANWQVQRIYENETFCITYHRQPDFEELRLQSPGIEKPKLNWICEFDKKLVTTHTHTHTLKSEATRHNTKKHASRSLITENFGLGSFLFHHTYITKYIWIFLVNILQLFQLSPRKLWHFFLGSYQLLIHLQSHWRYSVSSIKVNN